MHETARGLHRAGALGKQTLLDVIDRKGIEALA
jgi:hypothetical protein